MLELCRWTSVLGANGPAVALVTARVPSAAVDHGFDRKTHSRIESVDATLSVGEMGDRRVEVKLSPQSVADVFANNGETTSVGFGDDGLANRADAAARFERVDRQVQAVERTLGHGTFLFRNLTDQERFTLIAVPFVDDCGDVDVDNVAVFELVVIGDAVADDIVDAGAAALGIILVSERGRFVAVIRRPLLDKLVDGIGGHTRFDVRAEVVHQLRIDRPARLIASWCSGDRISFFCFFSISVNLRGLSTRTVGWKGLDDFSKLSNHKILGESARASFHSRIGADKRAPPRQEMLPPCPAEPKSFHRESEGKRVRCLAWPNRSRFLDLFTALSISEKCLNEQNSHHAKGLDAIYGSYRGLWWADGDFAEGSARSATTMGSEPEFLIRRGFSSMKTTFQSVCLLVFACFGPGWTGWAQESASDTPAKTGEAEARETEARESRDWSDPRGGRSANGFAPAHGGAVEMEARAPSGSEGELRFNFSGTSWPDVLEWFADQADLALQLDQVPIGSFTFADPTRSYSISEALDVINLALMKRGYSLVRRGRMLQVIDLELENADKLISELAELVRPEQLEERGKSDIVSCVFPLGSLTPTAAKEELALMIGPWGRVIVLDSARQVKVTETASKLIAIRDLLESASMADTSVVEIVLKNRGADEILEIARPLLGLEVGRERQR